MSGLTLVLISTLIARAAPEESVKFVPAIKFYECPPNFVYRHECKISEYTLEPQKLVLNIEVLEQRMGHWSLRVADPVPAVYHVIVVRGKGSKQYNYSVSTEAGLASSPTPLTNARAEFSDDSVPRSFGVSTPTLEKDGKKYLAEIRLTDFHGKAMPTQRKP